MKRSKDKEKRICQREKKEEKDQGLQENLLPNKKKNQLKVLKLHKKKDQKLKNNKLKVKTNKNKKENTKEREWINFTKNKGKNLKKLNKKKKK